MFSNLTNRLKDVFSNLGKQAVISEKQIDQAMRSIRIALLEADVALPVVKELVTDIKEKALGQDIIKSVSAEQMLIKIVHDHIVKTLTFGEGLDTGAKLLSDIKAGSVLLMAGLQGSGKTTFSAKIAKLAQEKYGKKVLMASLDIYRPAARLQLKVLGDNSEVDTLPIVEKERVLDITNRALTSFRQGGYDILILDSAGRLNIDDTMMKELADIKLMANPYKTILTIDSMMGQEAVNMATSFQEQIGVNGIVLSRLDGDAKGGATLSAVKVLNQPVLFIGVGEKVGDIQSFDPERIASRLLDMGDVVDLVNKAAEIVDEEEELRLQKRLKQGVFTLDDYKTRILKTGNMGGIQGIMNYLPGLSGLKSKYKDAIELMEKSSKKEIAIIDSMTKKERTNIELLKASRKKRIASGAGVEISEINTLLKKYREMKGMFIKFSKRPEGMMSLLKGFMKR